MGLTLNSKISDLILSIADIIKESDGKITTFDLEIPDQSFYLEIAIKSKEVENEMKWNKFTLRKTDLEEKEHFEADEIWDSPVPDSEEKVLVSDGITIWIDEWYQDLDGANLMDADALGLYWMPLPALPLKEVKNV